MGNSIFRMLGGDKTIAIKAMHISHENHGLAASHDDERVEPPPAAGELPTAGRLAVVQSEFDRFSAVLSREVAKFSAAHARLEADHAQIARRHAEMTKEFRDARETLEIAQSQNATLIADQTRLRDESAAAMRKLDAASADLVVTREKLGQHQARSEMLEAEHAEAVQECNRRDLALVEARQEINDLTQRLETTRVQVEQGRHRESEMEARSMMTDIELKELRPKMADVSRQAAQQREKLMAMEAELKQARAELAGKDRQIADLLGEREQLAADRDVLSVKLDESRHSSEMKVDALSKTKTFLWGMSEKQRKQISDQITRISRLESDNSRLTQALVDANGVGEGKNGGPTEKPAGKASGPKSSDGSLLN
jgi:chromosome segregation ATPase